MSTNSARTNIQPKAGLTGVATVFEVADAMVINGNVNMQVAFYDDTGKQLSVTRALLTEDQYNGWTNPPVVDDYAYFLECQATNFGITIIP